MKIIDPGHIYELSWLDGRPPIEHYNSDWNLLNDTLVFVKREGESYPGNFGHHAGTNLQEVLRACIDRVKYLDKQIHDDMNSIVIHNLREAIFCLESRAATRHKRKLSFIDPVENNPVCYKCGHIGCIGECHAD